MVKKISKDQSAQARAKRLAKGLCPIHGISFEQIDVEWGQCSWNGGCDIKARPILPADTPFDEITPGQWRWELMEQYQAILKGE